MAMEYLTFPPKPPFELCFFSLLNRNTQIGTPTRGLRKPLLPCETAYAGVTFKKCLRGCLRESCCNGSEEEYEELEDDDSLDDLWKEGGNLIKRGALCHGR